MTFENNPNASVNFAAMAYDAAGGDIEMAAYLENHIEDTLDETLKASTPQRLMAFMAGMLECSHCAELFAEVSRCVEKRLPQHD